MSKISLAYCRRILRNKVVDLRASYFRIIWKMDIGEGVRLSLTAKLDKTAPRHLHIGEYSQLTFRTTVLAHDFVNGCFRDTHIGAYCFIGCGSIIMPGIRIGDHCIIGAGSVVTHDIPSNSIAAGNPARVLRQGIVTIRHGQLAPEHSNKPR